MKKALYFAWAMGMVLVLTACGETAKVSNTSKASVQTEAAADKETATENVTAQTEEESYAEAPENQGENYSDEELAKLEEAAAFEAGEAGGDVPGTAPDDAKGLSSKHGKAYVYGWIGNEYLRDDGTWEFIECDGYIQDGETKLHRTLTVYRYSDSTALEYMLEFQGDWGEYCHVNYNYDVGATYFDCVENGYVTLSGNRAIWRDEYSEDFKEIYVLESTHEFDD